MPDFIADLIASGLAKEMPTLNRLLLCTVCSLIFGLAVAFIYMFRSRYSKSLAATLVLIPSIVQVIIMIVNGNVGAGIAVLGAFSLVRFRSIPGNARDIGYLFFAMALGFVAGMGHVFNAFIFLLLIGGAGLLLTCTSFAQGETDVRILRITIPENLDYDGLFNEVLGKYTRSAELEKVRTTNMGSLYELTYHVQLKSAATTKEFMDELRCMNGNLNILIGREQRDLEEL